jgi:hypothetical protein
MDSTTEVRARLQLAGNGRVWRLIEPCPFCGKHHKHTAGAGREDPWAHLGDRMAPCRMGRYVLAADAGAKRTRVVR